MKNESITTGDETAILIRRRSGEIAQVLISTSDLPRVQEFPNSWCLCTRSDGKSYAYGKIYSDQTRGTQGLGRTVYLHRWIHGLEAGDRREVDHIRWQTLDCRRSATRVISGRGNRAHRQLTSRPNANSTTGVRNVQLVHGSYVVVVSNRYIGSYHDLASASRAAAKARAEYTARKLQVAVASVTRPDYSTRMSDLHDALDRAARKVAA